MDFLTEDELLSLPDHGYQHKVILMQIFERYHQEVKRVRIRHLPIPLEASNISQYPFIFLVENAFRHCREQTQNIIYQEFVVNHKDKWYLKEMSSATYYRRRTIAYEEFLAEIF